MSLAGSMTLATAGSVALAVGYALGAVLIIFALCFAVVKAFGHSPRGRWRRPGSAGSGAEVFDPQDGTPHSTDG